MGQGIEDLHLFDRSTMADLIPACLTTPNGDFELATLDDQAADRTVGGNGVNEVAPAFDLDLDPRSQVLYFNSSFVTIAENDQLHGSPRRDSRRPVWRH